jgi:hypothetical protein
MTPKVTFINYYYGAQIKEDEMGKACSTQDAKWYKILVSKPKDSIGIDGRIILKYILMEQG